MVTFTPANPNLRTITRTEILRIEILNQSETRWRLNQCVRWCNIQIAIQSGTRRLLKTSVLAEASSLVTFSPANLNLASAKPISNSRDANKNAADPNGDPIRNKMAAEEPLRSMIAVATVEAKVDHVHVEESQQRASVYVVAVENAIEGGVADRQPEVNPNIDKPNLLPAATTKSCKTGW